LGAALTFEVHARNEGKSAVRNAQALKDAKLSKMRENDDEECQKFSFLTPSKIGIKALEQ